MSLKLDGKKLSLEIEERLNNYISSNKKIANRIVQSREFVSYNIIKESIKWNKKRG